MKKIISLVVLIFFMSVGVLRAESLGDQDKQSHFWGSATCAAALSQVFNLMNEEGKAPEFVALYPRTAAFLTCASLGLVKENAIDGSPDKHDLIANMGGSMLGITLSFTFDESCTFGRKC